VPEVRAFPPPFPREKSYQHGGITSGRSPSPLKPPKLATISLKLEANNTHTHTHTHPVSTLVLDRQGEQPLGYPIPDPQPQGHSPSMLPTPARPRKPPMERDRRHLRVGRAEGCLQASVAQPRAPASALGGSGSGRGQAEAGRGARRFQPCGVRLSPLGVRAEAPHRAAVHRTLPHAAPRLPGGREGGGRCGAVAIAPDTPGPAKRGRPGPLP
jgi:hypothetical protein